jgi:hypothetical protein
MATSNAFDRKRVINQILGSMNSRKTATRTLSHRIEGGVIWAVVEETHKSDQHKTRYLTCSLFFQGREGWSYLTVTEVNFCNLYHCPIEYLELTEPVNAAWRQHVHEYHALMSAPASCWVA